MSTVRLESNAVFINTQVYGNIYDHAIVINFYFSLAVLNFILDLLPVSGVDWFAFSVFLLAMLYIQSNFSCRVTE